MDLGRLKSSWGKKGISVAVYELINLMKTDKKENVSKKKKKKIEGTCANPVVQTATEVQFSSVFTLITATFVQTESISVVIRE